MFLECHLHYVSIIQYVQIARRTIFSQGLLQRIHPPHPHLTIPTSPFNISLQPTLTTLRNPIPKANSNSNNKRKTKERRTPLIMIADSNASLDLVDTPQVDTHGVEEGQTGDESESPRGCERDGVAEVEQSCGDGAEDDGEFELGERVSGCKLLVCEDTNIPMTKRCAPLRRRPLVPRVLARGSSFP
jgi:hypothetical protein